VQINSIKSSGIFSLLSILNIKFTSIIPNIVIQNKLSFSLYCMRMKVETTITSKYRRIAYNSSLVSTYLKTAVPLSRRTKSSSVVSSLAYIICSKLC
jgi:hypothetical protein